MMRTFLQLCFALSTVLFLSTSLLQTASSDAGCVIPPSGPWPPCATGGTPAPPGADCIIPPSGPWPPCATGGSPTPPSGGECVIPASGPWPPCATGGSGSTPSMGVRVVQFDVPARVIGGDPLMLSWQVDEVRPAQLLQIVVSRNNGYYDDVTPYGVAPQGSVAIATATSEDKPLVSSLQVWIELDGAKISATKTVRRDCTHEWFFLPAGYDYESDPNERKKVWGSCATEPLVSQASQQNFEGGHMIWVEEYNEIWVFSANDDQLKKYPDQFDASVDAVSDPSLTPPAGKLQPQYGFGKLWRENPAIREALGWAISLPVNFETVDQGNRTDFRDLQRFLRLADGGVQMHDVFGAILTDDARYTDINGYAHPHNGYRNAQQSSCVIPESGPWPPCATGG